MKFGALVPQGWRLDLTRVEPGYAQYQAMRGFALQLEQDGWDSMWVFDHFQTIPEVRLEATFEAWTTCAALAEATSRIRIGQIVTCNFYRNPTLVAKMASCLDVMCNGRMEFGLGAGWYEQEAIAYGYPYEKPSVRIGQMDEAIQVILGMWEHDEFQFEGKHYKVGIGDVHNFRKEPITLRGAVNHPKPLQKPHPPVWVGGGGEQLTLRSVARYADWANYVNTTVEQTQHKNRVLDEHCAKVGRDPATIGRSVLLECMFADDAALTACMERRARRPHEIDFSRQRALLGEPAQMIETLERYRDEASVEYVILYFLDMPEGDSARRFATEVMPALRTT